MENGNASSKGFGGLSGKVAIVTGGARGVGRGIARRLLREGVAVCSVDTDEEAGQAAARQDAGLGRLVFVAAAGSTPDRIRCVRSTTSSIRRVGWEYPTTWLL